MARVTAFGQPAMWWSRMRYLRGHLPDTYEIIHNLEIKQDKEVFEIDLVLLAPQCVFVVDIRELTVTSKFMETEPRPDTKLLSNKVSLDEEKS